MAGARWGPDAQGAGRAGEGRRSPSCSAWVPSLERAVQITGSLLRSAALQEEQAGPGRPRRATLGVHFRGAYRTGQRALGGEQGLLLIFRLRRPARARLSCNSMLGPQTLPMTRHFAPGGGATDWAAAAMAQGWTSAPGAPGGADLSPRPAGVRLGPAPDLPPPAPRGAQLAAASGRGIPHSPTEPAGPPCGGSGIPGTRRGAGQGQALSGEAAARHFIDMKLRLPLKLCSSLCL